MKSLQINNEIISEKNKPYIVAELSANHNGLLSNALEHIKIAKNCGANAIKIQTYTPSSMTIKSKKKDFIINSGLWKNHNLYDLYKWAQTPYSWHKKIFSFAKKNKITCFSTPFDENSVDFLEKLNAPAYKIASFELIDSPLVEYIAETKKPIILSTGMASTKEIDEAVNIIVKKNSLNNIILLHCVSNYPTLTKDMNLERIVFLKNRYKTLVGLSDHSKGMISPLVSVALGACMIEKHFIISKSINSPDKNFSILPNELKKLVLQTASAWESKGKGSIANKNTEKESKKYRRSIYVIRDIKKNQKITEKNVKRIRPGFGMSPNLYKKIIGKKTNKNLYRGDPLNFDDLL